MPGLATKMKAAEEDWAWGMRVGYGWGTLAAGSFANDKFEVTSTPSYSIGLTFDLPLTKNIFLQPGVTARWGGFKYNQLQSSYSSGDESTIIALPLSLAGVWRISLSKKIKLNLGVGYYWAYNIDGGSRIYVSTSSGNAGYSIANSDFGMILSPQLRLGNFFIGIQYDLGLKNVIIDGNIYDRNIGSRADEDASARLRNFMFTVGFNF